VQITRMKDNKVNNMHRENKLKFTQYYDTSQNITLCKL